jgi:predicted PurR-regulated permease PerM
MSIQTGRSIFGGLNVVNVLAIVLLLYISEPLIVPLLYGGFVAIILYPVCIRLEQFGFGRALAILVSMLLISILVFALLLLIFYQYRLFKRDLPFLVVKIKPLISSFRDYMQANWDITFETPASLLKDTLKYSGTSVGTILVSSINGTITFVFNIIIIPLYAVFILYFRSRLVRALISLAGALNHDKLQHILVKTIRSYGNYIKGMVIVYFIVGVLNSIGLLIIGVKYAVLFGMITAIMTIIPYFGIFISALLPISIAWLTTNSIYYPLGVILVFSIVQYLEGNFIYPYVVGKKMNVNILFSLIAIFAGGLLWGVSGMVLFLPIIAVIKIVSEELESWEPLRILLADKD